MISKLLNSSLKHLLIRNRYQAAYQFEPLARNNTHHNFRKPEIPKSYFNSKLNEVDPKCKQIISQMLQRPDNIAKQEQLLSQYLDLHGSINKIKSANDLLCLLVAIQMNNKPRLNSFTRTILEHLMRNRVQVVVMDEVQLNCFSQVMKNGLNASHQKAKYQAMFFTYLNVMQSHMDIINPFDYYNLVSLLIESRKNKLNFVKFALKFQQFLIQTYVIPWLQGRKSEKLEQFWRKDRNINSLGFLITEYNCTAENGELLFKFVQKFYLQDKIPKGNVCFEFISKLFRAYPGRTRAADGSFHKTKVLNAICQHLSRQKVTNLVGSNQILPYNFCNTIVHHCFYQLWMNLNFSQVNGIIFLQREQLKQPPTLPPLFWQFYSHYTELINSHAILRDTIKHLYPDKYKKTKTKDIIQTKEPTSESEMRIRMQIALMNLKLNYQKQVYLQSRYIDFLLDDKIVLQLDGLVHYDPLHFHNDDRTVYRNLHLLFAGYRLIVININQYNLHREVPQLTEIFKEKMKILKDYDCLAVI